MLVSAEITVNFFLKPQKKGFSKVEKKLKSVF
jgi:hypothetical protein